MRAEGSDTRLGGAQALRDSGMPDSSSPHSRFRWGREGPHPYRGRDLLRWVPTWTARLSDPVVWLGFSNASLRPTSDGRGLRPEESAEGSDMRMGVSRALRDSGMPDSSSPHSRFKWGREGPHPYPRWPASGLF